MNASISEALVLLATDADNHAPAGRPFYLSLRTAAILLGVTSSSLELALREEGAPSLLQLECAARGNAWTPPRRSERAWTHLRPATWEEGAHAAALARLERLSRAELPPASPAPAQASLLAPAPLLGLAAPDSHTAPWAPPVERWREVAAGVFWAFDTETTGRSSRDRIIELAFVEFEGGSPTGQRIVRRYNPEGRWSRGAELIHHIPLRDLEHEPLWSTRAAGLAGWLKGRTLVAHNVPFDRGMLERELERAGVEVPEIEWICSMGLSRRLHPKASAGLAAMCALKGIPPPTHHRADCDAEACGRLLVALASPAMEARNDAAA